MSLNLAASLTRASSYAQAQWPRVEHLLLALTEDPDAGQVLEASRRRTLRGLTAGCRAVSVRGEARDPPELAGNILVSPELRRILEAAAAAGLQGTPPEIRHGCPGGNRRRRANRCRSHARAQGLTFEEAIPRPAARACTGAAWGVEWGGRLAITRPRFRAPSAAARLLLLRRGRVGGAGAPACPAQEVRSSRLRHRVSPSRGASLGGEPGSQPPCRAVPATVPMNPSSSRRFPHPTRPVRDGAGARLQTERAPAIPAPVIPAPPPQVRRTSRCPATPTRLGAAAGTFTDTPTAAICEPPSDPSSCSRGCGASPRAASASAVAPSAPWAPPPQPPAPAAAPAARKSAAAPSAPPLPDPRMPPDPGGLDPRLTGQPPGAPFTRQCRARARIWLRPRRPRGKSHMRRSNSQNEPHPPQARPPFSAQKPAQPQPPPFARSQPRSRRGRLRAR